MSHPDGDLIPIPVTLAHPDQLAGLLDASRRKRHRDVTFRTIQLTTANPVKAIFAGDLSRALVIVQAFTNDVILCETQSKAEDPANASPAAASYPEGYLLAKANTTPTYLPTTDLAWATAATLPAQITVCLINNVYG